MIDHDLTDSPDDVAIRKEVRAERKLYAAGYVAMGWPKELGGQGADVMKQTIVNGRRSTMNARVILTVATLITTLVGATPAAALPYIVNRGLDTCGGIPVVAAMNVTAHGTPDDPVGIANCPALCEKFVTACRGAVDASVACWKKTVAKFAAVQAATCNVQSGAAKEACQATLTGDKVIAKEDYIDAGRTNGHSYCETTALFSCTVSCN